MALPKEYIVYTHHDHSIYTVGQFLDNLGLSIAKNMTTDEFLSYKTAVIKGGSEEFISNQQRIIAALKAQDFKDFTDGNGNLKTSRPKTQLPFPIGVMVHIPKTQAFSEIALIAGYDQTIPTEGIDNFMADNLKMLLSDPGYYPIDKTLFKPGEGILSRQYPNMSVWVWCRALSPESAEFIRPSKRNSTPDYTKGGSFETTAEQKKQLIRHFGMDGNLIDITPFIINAQTSVAGGGGNFSISLAPIEGERDPATGWSPSKKTIQAINSNEFVAQSKINKYNKDSLLYERTKFLFHNIIQPNDVIFIRFETLLLEKDRQDPSADWVYLIDKNQIAGKNYDMIGLVDQNNINSKSQGGVDVTIDIQGRDLSKLLLEDGSYFYPLAYTNYGQSDFGDQKLLRRLTITGKYPLFGEYSYRSIQYSIEFIVNQVSNITITPDSLWISYGDRVSKTLQIDSINEEQWKENQKILKEQAIENLRYSREIDGLQEEDAGKEQEALVKGFENMYKFMKATNDQNAWLYDRTTFKAFGWKEGTYNRIFVPINRYPPSWKNTLKLYGKTSTKLFNTSYQASDKSIIKINTSYGVANDYFKNAVNNLFQLIQNDKNSLIKHEPLPMPGIWQIIKFIYDPQIDNLRLADPSIAQPDGPLMNQMTKICQEPFVEFYGDTYGDLYYFTSRRPPFSKSAIERYASDFYTMDPYTTVSEQDAKEESHIRQIAGKGGGFTSYIQDKRQSFLIDIFEEDVLDDSLNFYDGEIYSFFELSPQASFLGSGSEVTTGYIPIIQIPEYAEMYGSKRLKVVNQYYRFDGHWRLSNFEQEDVIKQAAKDLQWLVETNMYLPFVRQGTITINGLRTIKRGTFIRYNPTKEIFYVTSVSQNYSINEQSIDRTTRLTVERGMIEDFIKGVVVTNAAGEEFNASYFDIVNVDAISTYIENFITDFDKAGKVMQGFVNHDVLNFFLKRNQFKDNISKESSNINDSGH